MRIWTQRALGAALAAMALTTAIGAWTPTAAQADSPAPPPPPAPGALGSDGPCGQSELMLPNVQPAGLGQLVWVFTPTGSAVPRTGGVCGDDQRPVVFFAHGYSGGVPPIYGDLIHNMVSNGHIVVYANYTLLAVPDLAYPQVDSGFVQAAGVMNLLTGNRMDLANIGIWGHSYGAGMTAWLAQRAGARGWGSSSLWVTAHSPYFSFKVGLEGPIAYPANARVHIIGYDQDMLDNRIGIETFESIDLPDNQKDHITIVSDCGRGGSCQFTAGHLFPVTWVFTDTYPADHLDFYGVYRNWQALSDCARGGVHCGADLSYMGTWSDGEDAPHAIVSKDPVDIGPPGVECGIPPHNGGLGPVRPCP